MLLCHVVMTPQIHRMFDNKQKQNHTFLGFSRTFLCLHAHFLLTGRRSFAKLRPQPRIGGIAKWPKASVCKTDIRGFKSHSRLSLESAVARIFLETALFCIVSRAYAR